jgi:hypothetical protein
MAARSEPASKTPTVNGAAYWQRNPSRSCKRSPAS